MRRTLILCVLLTACGDAGSSGTARATASPTTTPCAATPCPGATAARSRAAAAPASSATTPALSGPWSSPVVSAGEPLPCPVASSRAGRPDRVLALPGGRTITLDAKGLVDTDGGNVTHTPLPTKDDVWKRALACAKDGTIAVGWVEDTGGEQSRLRLALRRPGQPLGAPVTIATVEDRYEGPTIEDAALAFAPDGRLLVVWPELKRVRALTIAATGSRGRTVTLGKASDSTVVAAEISRSGRAVVAWTTQDLGEERNQPHVIRAAFRAPGHTFAKARTVDSGGGVVDPEQYAHDPQSGLRLAVGDDGRALLQWGALSEPRRYHYDHPIRLASASPRGRFGHRRTLAGDGYPGDVAIRRDRTPLIVWYADKALRASVDLGADPTTLDTGKPFEAVSATFLSDGRAEVGWDAAAGHTIAVRSSP